MSDYVAIITESFDKKVITNVLTEQRWVSVKDRKPNRKDKVLVFDQYGNIDVSMFGWTSFDDFDSLETQVTHWMPLPEPPK